MSDVELASQHGWSANSAWFVDKSVSPSEATFTLDQKIMGATLTKYLRCAADAPLLYQTHHFTGGTGAIPMAHHVITHMKKGGQVCHSPKRLAITPDVAPDPGLNYLICSATSADLRNVPSRDGTADLTQYPVADSHEDFLSLVEDHGTHLGWTAVLRKAEGDILFVL
ncbi:MAG: hypothetical protein ACSHXB_19615 [Sulfitobacter sp.]